MNLKHVTPTELWPVFYCSFYKHWAPQVPEGHFSTRSDVCNSRGKKRAHTGILDLPIFGTFDKSSIQ
jgi:hypothetical protein